MEREDVDKETGIYITGSHYNKMKIEYIKKVGLDEWKNGQTRFVEHLKNPQIEEE